MHRINGFIMRFVLYNKAYFGVFLMTTQLKTVHKLSFGRMGAALLFLILSWRELPKRIVRLVEQNTFSYSFIVAALIMVEVKEDREAMSGVLRKFGLQTLI